jgi:anti-sigma B factor antagonist
MEMVVEKSDDIAIVTPRVSFLDASNYQEFKQDINGILETNHKVILDISHLRFVDSSGLGAILSCLRKLVSSGGDLKLLCEKSKPVRMFFEMVRMNRIIDIFTTREEAVVAFRKPPLSG